MKKLLKRKQFVEFVLTHVKKKTLSKWNAVAKETSGLYTKIVQLNGLAEKETRTVKSVGRKYRIYPSRYSEFPPPHNGTEGSRKINKLSVHRRSGITNGSSQFGFVKLYLKGSVIQLNGFCFLMMFENFTLVSGFLFLIPE